MLKLKGTYKWKLIQADTNKVVQVGQQNNIVTDVMARDMGNRYYGFDLDNSHHRFRIILSTVATPLPVLEYREYGVASANITRDVLSDDFLTITADLPARTAKCSFNFIPPGSPRTITVIGIDLLWHNGFGWQAPDEFLSFIELTTPITQQASQFFFVEYTLAIEYSGGLLNASDNELIKQWVNSDISTRFANLGYNSNDHFIRYSPFLTPANKSNVARYSRDNGTGAIWIGDAPAVTGCKYANTFEKIFTSTEMVGLVGCPIWSDVSAILNLGFFDSNISASTSRVYIHPAANIDQIFSDPANPPSSRGTTTLTGTPSNKFPMVCRINITKTGDASDITDETFTTDFTLDELTVGQDDWAIDDIIQVSTTGILPSPLVVSTDYYVITKTGTSPNVKLTLSATLGGAVINLTDNGSGTHTVVRQITGEYNLELEPYYTTDRSYQPLYQLAPAIDYDGNIYPFDYTTMKSSFPCFRDSDYVYVLNDDANGEYLNLFRWPIYSVETVTAIAKFGTTSVILYASVQGTGTYSNYVYIATSEGVYRLDKTTFATTLLTITGGIDSDIRDITFDEITEYLWTGHVTGLSRVDLGTNIATQYTTAGALTGMTAGQAQMIPGGLTAYNGKVLCCKTSWNHIWYLDDGVGYSLTTAYGTTYGGTINKSNGYVVTRYTGPNSWTSFNVTGIVGPNTGTFNVIDTQSASDNYIVYLTSVLQLDSNTFLGFSGVFSPRDVKMELYTVGTSVTTQLGLRAIVGASETVTASLETTERNLAAARNYIDISEGYGVDSILVANTLVKGIWPNPRSMGWSGSAWVKDNATSRRIPSTLTHALTHGITVQFNNAVGETWDKQFVLGERYTFMISPTLIKDNLQEYTTKLRTYYTGTKRIVNWTTTAASTITIPEAPTGSAPDVDFREMDETDFVTEVYDITSAATLTRAISSPPGAGEYFSNNNGTVEFNAAEIGNSVRLTYNYTVYA